MTKTQPPPIPIECEFNTPLQSEAAMAASTAFPPFNKIDFPTREHSSLSTATAAREYLPNFDDSLISYDS